MQFILRSSRKDTQLGLLACAALNTSYQPPKSRQSRKTQVARRSSASSPCVAQPLTICPRGWHKLRRVCRERVGQAGRHIIQSRDPGRYDILPEP